MYKKTAKEMELIIEGGQKLGAILEELASSVRPGMTSLEIDTRAEQMIREAGGIPAFKGYRTSKHDRPFPGTICASINDEVVHGVPSDRVLEDGDIFSIDIGMQYPANSGLGEQGNGFFTDTAVTVVVGSVPESTKQLLGVTKKSLYKAIEQCQVGNTIADIGKTVEDFVTPHKYGIVRTLSGHGVGHKVHEDPWVPNYYVEDLQQWAIEPGVVIAIEPMLIDGSHEVFTADDDWTIKGHDRALSAHFEHTIVVTEDGPVVATKRPSEQM